MLLLVRSSVSTDLLAILVASMVIIVQNKIYRKVISKSIPIFFHLKHTFLQRAGSMCEHFTLNLLAGSSGQGSWSFTCSKWPDLYHTDDSVLGDSPFHQLTVNHFQCRYLCLTLLNNSPFHRYLPIMQFVFDSQFP